MRTKGKAKAMKCEACEKLATAKEPVHVVAGSNSDDSTDYMLICGTCIVEPEKWVPSEWNFVVDNVGKIWWEREIEV